MLFQAWTAGDTLLHVMETYCLHIAHIRNFIRLHSYYTISIHYIFTLAIEVCELYICDKLYSNANFLKNDVSIDIVFGVKSILLIA